MGIKYKLKLKDLKFEYLKEYFIPFLKYFKKTKKIENYSDLKEFIQKKDEFCILLALIQNNAPVFSFIYDPNKKTSYKRGNENFENVCFD